MSIRLTHRKWKCKAKQISTKKCFIIWRKPNRRKGLWEKIRILKYRPLLRNLTSIYYLWSLMQDLSDHQSMRWRRTFFKWRMRGKCPGGIKLEKHLLQTLRNSRLFKEVWKILWLIRERSSWIFKNKFNTNLRSL